MMQTERHASIAWLLWLLLGLATQAGQGLYPVAARYLQQWSAVQTLQLNFTLNFVAALALGCFSTLPSLCWRCVKQRWAAQRTRAYGDSLEAPLLGQGGGRQGSPGAPVILQDAPHVPGWLESMLTASTAAVCIALTGLAQVVAVRFTAAYWSQLVFLSTPLLVAALARIAYGDSVSRSFFPTVAFTMVGAALIVVGGVASSGSAVGFTRHDAIGMTFALGGAIALAGYVVVVQHSAGIATPDQILWANFAFQLPLSLSLSYALEQPDWRVFAGWTQADWVVFLSASLGVYWGCNRLQQPVIRVIGGPIFATFMPVRLIASQLGSWALLSEKIKNPLQYCGIAVVLATITAYLLTQGRSKQLQELEEEEEEVAPLHMRRDASWASGFARENDVWPELVASGVFSRVSSISRKGDSEGEDDDSESQHS